MKKKSEAKGRPGHRPLPYSIPAVIWDLKEAFGDLHDDLWTRFSDASGVMLDTVVTQKGHVAFITIQRHIAELIALGAAEHGRHSTEFDSALKSALLTIDVNIIRALGNGGLLSEFLNAGGESLSWLFSRKEEESQSENDNAWGENSSAWARQAMDNNRAYYQAVYRFWEIFIRGGVQSHVIDALSDGLPMVSLAYGDYRNTVRICNAYIDRYTQRGGLTSEFLLAHHKTYKASALSCMGLFAAADDLYDEVDAGLAKCQARLTRDETAFERASLRPGTDAWHVNVRSRLALRERLRSEIRKTWIDLHLMGWPAADAPHIRQAKAIVMRDELVKRVNKAPHACEPTDFDTLARATILLEPSSLGSAEEQVTQWIEDALVQFKRQPPNMVEGSNFAQDTINITQALYWIARNDIPQARVMRDKLLEPVPLDQRQHTSRALRAIISFTV